MARPGGEAAAPHLLAMTDDPHGDARLDVERLSRRVDELERSCDAFLKAVIPIGVSLLVARDFLRMLETILGEAKALCHADGGTLYLRTDDERLRFVIMRNDSLGIAMGGASGVEVPFPPIPLLDPVSGRPNESNVASYAALTGRCVNVADAYEAHGFEFSGTRAFDRRSGYRSRSFLTVPLKSQDGRVIGVLQLLNALDPATGAVIPFAAGLEPVVEALCTLAAAALEVYRREEGLRQQIRDLHIQIDEGKKARQVSAIADSDYFRELQEQARQLRRT